MKKVKKITRMHAVGTPEKVEKIAKMNAVATPKKGKEITKMVAVASPKNKTSKAKGHVAVASGSRERSRLHFRCRYDGTSFSMSYTAATMQAVKLKAHAWLAKQ